MAIPVPLSRTFEEGPYRRNIRLIQSWSEVVGATLTPVEPPVRLRLGFDEEPYHLNVRALRAWLDIVQSRVSLASFPVRWPFEESSYRRNMNALIVFGNDLP